MNKFEICIYTKTIDIPLIHDIHKVYPYINKYIYSDEVFENSKYKLFHATNKIEALKKCSEHASKLLIWLEPTVHLIQGFDDNLIDLCAEYDICYRPRIGYPYNTSFISFNMKKKGKKFIQLLTDPLEDSLQKVLHEHSWESDNLNPDLMGQVDISNYIEL